MSLPDDIWAELAQEIPTKSDPFLQQYLAGRTNLIDQESSSRSDASFRASLSPIAKRACAIADRIRRHEQATVWDPSVEEKMAQETHSAVFPGMMFMMAKQRMEDTKLWKIVRRMPKGALLHAHMDAMVEFDFILDELLETPGMHMASDRPLDSPEALEDGVPSFRYRSKGVDSVIWEAAYKPGEFIPIKKCAQDFPGGKEGFLKWLKSRCTLSLDDSHQQHHGVNAIWVKFVKCFMVVATIIHYEPMFRSFLRRLMSILKADGVNWAELRYVHLRSCATHVVFDRECLRGSLPLSDSHGPSTTAAIARKKPKPTTPTCSPSSGRRSPGSRRRPKVSPFGV